MTLNDFFNRFPKTQAIFRLKDDSFKSSYFNYFLYPSIIVIFLTIFMVLINTFNEKKRSEIKNLNAVIETTEFKNLGHFLFSKINSPYTEIEYLIQNRDSVEKILKKFKINSIDTKNISKILKEKKLANIYAGRKLSLIIKKKDNKTNSVVNLIYPVNNTLSIEIRKNKDSFILKENFIKLNKKEVVLKGEIKNNLYSSAVEAGIEPNIIVEFARVFGFEVDFQRDIRKGDWYEILYEKFLDDNNIVKDTGKIIYASMFVNGEEINLYSYKDGKEIGFYDINGKSIVKSLMKTPINGARLSSSYGMRKHPILGYNKMHRGTDFAAPSGTPIMASGAGKITRARWCGGGGNCVKIKHNSTYETVYAHMKNFAKGVKEGRRVRQGQIIGYVGSTGLSTGPHLHYEVIVNGKKVNSQKLKLPSGKILKGESREKFELERIKIDLKLSNLR